MVQHHAVYTHPDQQHGGLVYPVSTPTHADYAVQFVLIGSQSILTFLEVSLWMPCYSGVACEMASMG